jgi:hypothetical protein
MNFYSKHLEDFKKDYILYIPLTIIFQSCLGSIAAMYILMNADMENFPFFQLTSCVVTAMAFNAAIMANLNRKLTFNLLILSIVVNAGLFFVNFMHTI